MKRNVNCSSDDYDFYTIPFPLKVILYKKRNRYISSQLEKLHPCFSDDCSFDSHLRLEKSGLKADVVVMQKYRVAEYKLLNKRLFVKERRHVQFFADRNKRSVLLVSSIAVAVLIFCVVLPRVAAVSQVPTVSSHEAISPPSEPFSNETSFTGYSAPELLALISKLKGNISDFFWSYDGFNESVSISLCKIFPEQLEAFTPELKLSSVIFEKSEPLLTASYVTKKINSTGFEPQQLSAQKSEIRRIIIQNGLLITEETVKPFGLRISVPQNEQNRLIPVLQYLQSNNFCVESISINSSPSGVWVQINFSQAAYENQSVLYESLISNIKLFEPEQAREIQKGSETKLAASHTQPTHQEKLSKLGQIVKPDGSIIQYFKDENGKITVR